MRTIKNNKTYLVFPRELSETIDKLLGKRKRSQFVVEATKEKLAKEKFARAMKRAAGCWKDKDYPEFRTKKDVDRYIRKLRESWEERLKRIYVLISNRFRYYHLVFAWKKRNSGTI
ncbi:MAG: hypothetical protein COU43_01335 [Candidatus Nealsonbacteria bacterium CG10_big_fil_rev_8_21_14_0_10_37_25]|uniref:Uncharacterized protein n=1 Tax=Candidatus Nealsonbacteria bacterium CG10_big_fil_rev_8_21_14_0_10_37_25 TaxID=1974711 RepID=A0A2H0TJD0_9BACT|nr:MAG: hypothetical protein COU43_01335 [Candidatus Nealsonbacteria bacterium CG10_big_fil_rev_8_21_14_0_10_37_25]